MTTQTAAPAALELNAYGVPIYAPITDADRASSHGLEYLEQPLANYGARISEHGVDYDVYVPHPGTSGRRRGGYVGCKCGRQLGNANGRGIHEAAEIRKADRLYSAECETAREVAYKS